MFGAPTNSRRVRATGLRPAHTDNCDRASRTGRDLVRRNVTVIYSARGSAVAQSAKAATTSIPIVFTGAASRRCCVPWGAVLRNTLHLAHGRHRASFQTPH